MCGLKIENRVCARIPTQDGEYQLCLYTTEQDDKEHLALIMGNVNERPGVLVRVHSECFTGDVLGSRRCDCGEQLHRSIQAIAEAGSGILIYLRQEGRGIGLLDKLRAYNLQDLGYDTVEANLVLGHQADERDYTIAAAILRDLRVESVCLLTNNPAKIEHLRRLGIPVVKRIPLEPTITDENAGYLLTKVKRMNHLLSLNTLPVANLKEPNGSGNGSH